MSLKIIQTKHGEDIHMHLSGMLDENANLPDFSKEIPGMLVVNLSEVSMINSLGCRVWSKWIKTVRTKHGVFLRECSSAFIAQVNVLQNFIPAGVSIESLQVPYVCIKCNHSERTILPLANARTAPDQKPCPRCGGVMEINVVRSKYFHFLDKKAA